ncbi:MAG: hypothetical protein H0U84_06700 [Thermoleophilaceae bacterium]|nr:hypothetical protein [Thermoleophilaceae bacterium]
MGLRRMKTVAACALALAFVVTLASCGEEPGVEEPAREGLALELGDLEYNVFITRQLNPDVAPDKAYYTGPDVPKGETLYGVFLQVCNKTEGRHESTDNFVVKDNQHEEFEPEELPEGNPFAYHPRTLGPEECIPEAGSVAQLGPTEATMLLFRLPVEVTENRPLELEIVDATGESLTYELDL